jgi:hypothetical protein
VDWPKAGLVGLGLLGLVIASPKLTQHVGWLDREATIAVGSAITGGAVIAYAVLEAEQRADRRRSLQDSARERLARAAKVVPEVRIQSVDHDPDDQSGAQVLVLAALLRNYSGYRITDVDLAVVRNDWTRKVLVLLGRTGTPFFDHFDQPNALPDIHIPVPAGQDVPAGPFALVLTHVDFDGHRFRRWPDGTIEPMEPSRNPTAAEALFGRKRRRRPE